MKLNDLIVLTVSTIEIPNHSMKMFIESMNLHNYNYKILGRDLKWDSFQTKTKICIDEINKIKHLYKYIVICDCTDVFVTASSKILVDILNSDPNVYIGGEYIPYYNKGKHTYQQIISFLQLHHPNTSLPIYPNGGFLCGPINDISKIMEKIYQYKDDQAGYMDLIFEGAHINVDSENKFVANIPNYNYFPYSLKNFSSSVINNYKHDKILNRFYNTKTLQYPIFLHFPGKNFDVMNNFYNVITTLNSSINYDIKTDNKSIFISVFIFILLFIIIYITHLIYTLCLNYTL